MDETLVEEAKTLGINVSMYWLLPPKKRNAALRADIAKAKQQRSEEFGKA